MKEQGLKQLNEIIGKIIMDENFLHNLLVAKNKIFIQKMTIEKLETKFINIHIGNKIIVETNDGNLEISYQGREYMEKNIHLFYVKRII